MGCKKDCANCVKSHSKHYGKNLVAKVMGVYHMTVGRFTRGIGESPVEFVASGLGQRLWT